MNDRAQLPPASGEVLSGLALLRKPFAENQISKLPKPLKKREEMDRLPKAKCDICGGYHATSMIIHLDYVGHAAVTNRLLDADPFWTWEPLAFDVNGLPQFDAHGGLWIKLTVCGVTRFGYGDAQGKIGPNAVKEAIGDAIRNVTMRGGVALDLWHKGDLHGDDEPPGDPPPPAPPPVYPEADFEKNFPTWQGVIQSGKRTAADVIATVETRGLLSDAQKKKLRGIGVDKGAKQ